MFYTGYMYLWQTVSKLCSSFFFFAVTNFSRFFFIVFLSQESTGSLCLFCVEVCKVEIMFFPRNIHVAINLLQKLPFARNLTKGILDSCLNHCFCTLLAKWEFNLANMEYKLTNLADIFHDETHCKGEAQHFFPSSSANVQ